VVHPPAEHEDTLASTKGLKHDILNTLHWLKCCRHTVHVQHRSAAQSMSQCTGNAFWQEAI